MPRACERGYAMAALLVGLSVMGIMLGMALPAWRTFAQREREAELIFRGEQYAQAIALFSRRTGGFPTSLAALRDGRYIRKLYTDPITNGDFQPVYLGQVGPLTPPLTGAGRGGPTPPAAGRGQPQPAGQQPFGQQPFGRAGQPAGQQPFGPAGQPAAGTPGQPGATGAGPIIGVVSRSTGDAMRLYNGRGKYNEWLFVSTAATQQAGAPVGGAPGLPGRGQGPAGRGRGGEQIGPGRGIPGRGVPGRGPGGFQPSPFGRPGGPGNAPTPFSPGQRGRL